MPLTIRLARRAEGSRSLRSSSIISADSFETPTLTFTVGTDMWVSSDNHTISVRVALADLGCPKVLRLSAHVVNAVTGNEWKDVAPSTHTPWTSASEGFYVIDRFNAWSSYHLSLGINYPNKSDRILGRKIHQADLGGGQIWMKRDDLTAPSRSPFPGDTDQGPSTNHRVTR